MSIGFWAAVPDSDFIVNFITRSATSLYTGGITCAVMLPPIWALGLAFLFMLIVRQRYSATASAAMV
jgi:hypothetical protein